MSDGARFVRPSLEQLPPGDPLPPVTADLASLGLNEGLSGPFPSALLAIEENAGGVNRYPQRGSAELTAALAARHGVPEERVVPAAGADALIGYVCQAVLDPGDEVVIPWPSFPSFVRDTQKRDAVPVTVALVDGRVDVAATEAALTERTKLLFLATPNNPTGLTIPAADLVALVRGLPERVLTVIDEAYFDYLDPQTRFDAIADLVQAGDDVLALRTFSKLYGLAGLRVGYGVGPVAVVAAIRKVQRGYDVSLLAQVAALASIGDEAEATTRRAANREAVAALTALLQAHGLEPLAGSVTNFVLVDIGRNADEATRALLRAGVSVQSGVPFGAPTSLRIGAGSTDDLALLDAALRTAGLGAR